MRDRLIGVAVALLLVALGIGIGAGPLQHPQHRAATAQQKAALRDRDRQINQLRDAQTLGSAYVGATAARVVAGTLTGRKVAIVALPGAAQGEIDLLRGLVHAAGAQVTADVMLGSALLAAGNSGLVDALTSQILGQTAGLSVPAATSPYQRFGAVLYRGIGVPPAAHVVGAPYDTAAISVVAGLKAAKLVTAATVTERAGLTIVVLPAQLEATATAAATAILSSYASYGPTVVAGPASSAAQGGLLAALRAVTPNTLSTVDSFESSAGRVATVLALAARTRGIKGAYGVIGTVDRAVPPTS